MFVADDAPAFVLAHELLHLASAIIAEVEPPGEEAAIRSITQQLQALMTRAQLTERDT